MSVRVWGDGDHVVGGRVWGDVTDGWKGVGGW